MINEKITQALNSPDTVSSVILSISSVTLAFLGVDYYSLVGGFVGAAAAVMFSAVTQGRMRTIVFLGVSAIVAAILGVGAGDFFGRSTRPTLTMFCLIIGFGAQAIMTAAVAAIVGRLHRVGGIE